MYARLGVHDLPSTAVVTLASVPPPVPSLGNLAPIGQFPPRPDLYEMINQSSQPALRHCTKSSRQANIILRV